MNKLQRQLREFEMPGKKVTTLLSLWMAIFALVPTALYSAGDHDGGHDEAMEVMRDLHGSHEHEHDFGVIDEMTEEQRERLRRFMTSIGVALPPMSSERGREVFLEKGCVVCHSVNGVGGETGPNLDAANMPSPMNVFEFAARMWRGAPAMVLMQQDQFGDLISLTGEELADLVAFVHDEDEQKELDISQVPAPFLEMMNQ